MSTTENHGTKRDLENAHTPLPWVYRPHRLDDWGWVRGPKEGLDEIGPLVAQVRSGRYESQSLLDEHRRNKTDPWEANARFIVRAVNSHEALVSALTQFVAVCDTAPPTSLIIEIGEACKVARSALAAARGEQ